MKELLHELMLKLVDYVPDKRRIIYGIYRYAQEGERCKLSFGKLGNGSFRADMYDEKLFGGDDSDITELLEDYRMVFDMIGEEVRKTERYVRSYVIKYNIKARRIGIYKNTIGSSMMRTILPEF